MVTLMTATLTTVGTFGGFCLAANSVEGTGQKMITGVSENSNNSESKKIVKTETSNEKIAEEIKKIEKSILQNNNSSSNSDVKYIVVKD